MNTKVLWGAAGRGRLAIALVVALVPAAGCKGLINVNGKPLGGGSTPSSSSGGSTSSSSSGGGGDSGDGSYHEPEHRADKPEQLTDDDYEVVKPEGMDDAAVFKPGRIPWCPPGKWTGEVWDKNRLRRGVSSSYGASTGTTWMNSLEQICQWADDKTWQKQAMYIEQSVMNYEHVSQADAIEKIKKWTAANKVARENEGKEPTDEQRMAFTDSDFTVEKPANGVATAKINGAIPWCDVAPKSWEDKWNPGRIGRTISNRYAGVVGTAEGALHLCQRPKDSTWVTEATYVLQRWMNWTKQSQDEAIVSMRARVQAEKFEGERVALCKTLEISPELGGEAKAYALAHRSFFGCNDDKQALWQGGRPEGELAFFFDGDDHLDSEVLRLAWLFGEVMDPDDLSNPLPAKSASDNRVLLDYAVASPDFSAIDTKALGEMVKKEPYNTSYAKAVINESVATLKWRKKQYDGFTDAMIKQGGDDYAAILRDAPKKGFAEWQKVTAPWKAELERARGFEKKLGNPSRKVLAGCSTELTPDAQKLFKSYKKDDYNELMNAVTSDPVAQLILSRLAVCYAFEKVAGSGVLRELVQKGRDYRGPRSMAYYFILDAVAQAKADRPGLLLGTDGYSYRTSGLTSQYDFGYQGSIPWRTDDTRGKGYVGELKKTADGGKIVFKKTKVTYPEEVCRSTNRITRITENGSLEYQQICHETGKMLSDDTTPEPVDIPANQMTGISAGVFVVTSGNLVPFTKKKADDKKILTFFGWQL